MHAWLKKSELVEALFIEMLRIHIRSLYQIAIFQLGIWTYVHYILFQYIMIGIVVFIITKTFLLDCWFYNVYFLSDHLFVIYDE